MTVQTASEEICRWSRELLSQGVASDNTGCLSLRIGDRMVITPEGHKLSELKPENICVVDLPSCTPEQGKRPDARFALHAAIYKKRKKLSALLHADSLSILTSSRAGLEVPPLLDDMAQIVGVSAKVATTWPYRGTAPVISAMKGRHAVLLKDAGALCGGSSIDDALAVAQVLEKGCKAFIESSFLGGGVRINPVEAFLMRTVYQFKYSKQDTANARG